MSSFFLSSNQVAKEEQFLEMAWEFRGDLLSVADFDGKNGWRTWSSSIIQYGSDFFYLPLGMMNEATGRKIWDKVGKALEVDVEDDGSAIEKYLRDQGQIGCVETVAPRCDDER